MGEWCWFGPHGYQMTDDLLLWRPGGVVLPEHAELVCKLLEQLIARYSYALWLVDAAAAVPIGHATRLVYARWFAAARRRLAVGSFGASRSARTTAALTARGAQLQSQAEVRQADWDSEAAARRFLAVEGAAFRSSPPKLAPAD
jgi:hypothetical protein